MKKLTFILTLAIMFVSFGCKADGPGLVITGEGIGPVKLGATVKDLPASADGLYDKINEEYSDFVLYSFYLDGNQTLSTNGDDSIQMIEIFPELKDAATADGVYVGMPLSEFKKKDGWKNTDENRYEKDGVIVYLQEYEGESEPSVTIQIGEFE